jgi:hypothetical protein
MCTQVSRGAIRKSGGRKSKQASLRSKQQIERNQVHAISEVDGTKDWPDIFSPRDFP